MRVLEIEGKTIDEAIERACDEFKVPREKLNIEIISEGASGFWGLGAKKAKIKAGILSIDVSTLGDSLQPPKQVKPEDQDADAAVKPAAVVSSEVEASGTSVARPKNFWRGCWFG
jgi:predicted RNA-binding protein Jag